MDVHKYFCGSSHIQAFTKIGSRQILSISVPHKIFFRDKFYCGMLKTTDVPVEELQHPSAHKNRRLCHYGGFQSWISLIRFSLYSTGIPLREETVQESGNLSPNYSSLEYSMPIGGDKAKYFF